jgi:hypothetical protein
MIPLELAEMVLIPVIIGLAWGDFAEAAAILLVKRA